MRRTLIAWLIVLPWALWVVARVLGLERGYPFVQLMAYTPYVLGPALVAGVFAALLRRWAPAALAAATLVVLATLLAPRAIGNDAQPGGPQLRVMTANAYRGSVPPDALVELVRRERVDVLVVQELTPELADGLDELMPHRQVDPGRSSESGIYSMLPLRALPPFEGAKWDMAAAEIQVQDAAPVRVISVHVAVPLRGDDLPHWRADLRNLPAAAPNGPVQLLAGDFNSTLDHRELRRLVGRGYREATGAGFGWTWRGDVAPPVTIDHVLVPERIGVLDVSVHDPASRCALVTGMGLARLARSDHRAVVAAIALTAR